MLTPSRLGISFTLSGFFNLPTARNTASAATSKIPAASTRNRNRSMVNRALSWPPPDGPPAAGQGSRPARSTAAAPWPRKPSQQLRSAPPTDAHSLPRGGPQRSPTLPLLPETARPSRSQCGCAHQLRRPPRRRAARSPSPAPTAAPAPSADPIPSSCHPERTLSAAKGQPKDLCFHVNCQAPTSSSQSGTRRRNLRAAVPAPLPPPAPAPRQVPRQAQSRRRVHKPAQRQATRSSSPATQSRHKPWARRRAPQTRPVPPSAYRRAPQGADSDTTNSDRACPPSLPIVDVWKERRKQPV